MTLTTQPLSIEDYLQYGDRTDTPYELVAGELVAMRSHRICPSSPSPFS